MNTSQESRICNLTEAIDKQMEIIRLQSSIIDDLFMIVLQLESTEAIDRSIYERMQLAAREREDLEGCRPE